MSWVIQDRRTGEYVTNGYSQDAKDINRARIFAQKNHAHSSRDYHEAYHELVPVLLVEDTSRDRVRKGKWITEQQYLEDYNGDLFLAGETIPTKYSRGASYRVSPDQNFTMDERFQVEKGKVCQAVIMEQQYAGSGNWSTYGPVMLQVHPTKQTTYEYSYR